MTHHWACADDLEPGRTVTGPRRAALPPVQVRADSNEAGRGLVSTALPLLTAAEEPVLGFWIEAGVLAASVLNASLPPSASCRAQLKEVRVLGERSMERMTRSNVRLVYWCISRYWTGRDTAGLEIEDLAAAGIEGLIHAIWMWDYQRGLKFSTYAHMWIRQHIERAVSRARPVRPTRVELQRIEELFQARVVLESQLGRVATGRELAAELRTTGAALRDLLLLERNVGYVVSLDQPLARDGASTFGDLLAAIGPTPEQLVESRLLRDELETALEHLPARESSLTCKWTASTPIRAAAATSRASSLGVMGRPGCSSRRRAPLTQTSAHPNFARRLAVQRSSPADRQFSRTDVPQADR